MFTKSFAALALTAVFISVTPATAEAADGHRCRPTRTQLQQIAQILRDHAAQVRPIHQQIGAATSQVIQDVYDTLTPGQQARVQQLPQEVQVAVQQAVARFQALPADQRTVQKAVELLTEELTIVLQALGDDLNLTAQQFFQITQLTDAYAQQVALLADQLAVIRAETIRKIEAVLPCFSSH